MSTPPLVALYGRSPAIRDFGEQQRLNLENQNLRGQNALQPGQLEGQQNELQQQRLQLKQMEAVLQGNQAVVSAQHDPEWNASDPDQVVRMFRKYNVPLPLQGQAMKVITDMQTGMMGASKESLAMAKQAHDYLDDQIEAAKSAPPDSQQKAYRQALDNARSYYSQFPDGPKGSGGICRGCECPGRIEGCCSASCRAGCSRCDKVRARICGRGSSCERHENFRGPGEGREQDCLRVLPD